MTTSDDPSGTGSSSRTVSSRPGGDAAGRPPAQRVPDVGALDPATLKRSRLLQQARARLRAVDGLRVEQEIILAHSAQALAASGAMLRRSRDRSASAGSQPG